MIDHAWGLLPVGAVAGGPWRGWVSSYGYGRELVSTELVLAVASLFSGGASVLQCSGSRPVATETLGSLGSMSGRALLPQGCVVWWMLKRVLVEQAPLAVAFDELALKLLCMCIWLCWVAFFSTVTWAGADAWTRPGEP